jgi:predicted nucleotide-binding protein (sugar kinase/HSP70/actin superfamily)
MAQSETKFTPEFMAQQRELAEQVDELRKLDEDAVQSYLDCGGLVKVYPRFSLHNARIINTFKSNAANNFIPALDEIERQRTEANNWKQCAIICQESHELRDKAGKLVEAEIAQLRARVAELEASEARLEKGNAAYEELTRRLVERFSDQIAWSDIIEMQVEISRERK